MSYPDVGIDLWLEKERVYMLGINDRKYTSAELNYR
jgi:hypothetical protein